MVKSTEQVPIPPSMTGIVFESSGVVVWVRAKGERARKIRQREEILRVFMVMVILEYVCVGGESSY
jgi:hypothetical protein